MWSSRWLHTLVYLALKAQHAKHSCYRTPTRKFVISREMVFYINRSSSWGYLIATCCSVQKKKIDMQSIGEHRLNADAASCALRVG